MRGFWGGVREGGSFHGEVEVGEGDYTTLVILERN